MSLNASKLDQVFCQKNVYLRCDLLEGVDLKEFLYGLAPRSIVHFMAEEFQQYYSNFTLPLDKSPDEVICAMYATIVSHMQSQDLVVYFLFDPAYRGITPLIEVDFSVRDNDFLILFNDKGAAVIVARRGDVSIRSVSLAELSPATQQIFKSHCGYHTDDGKILSLQTFGEKLEFETLELGNTDIYAFFSKISKKVADLNIPLDYERISPSVAKYFNTQLLNILSADFDRDFSKFKCCWVSPSVEALRQVYITPFKDYSPGIMTVRFSGCMTCASDLGIDGALILADDISVSEYCGGESN